MNANQLLAQLKTLAGEGGECLFRRVALAAALLKDRDWLGGDMFRGSSAKARDYLQEDFFGDCGLVSLGQLLEIHEAFPTAGEWKDRKYSVQKLWGEVLRRRQEARGESRQGVQRPESPAGTPATQAEQAREEPGEEPSAERQQTDVGKLREENRKLREENRKVLRENKKLRGRVRDLTAEVKRLGELIAEPAVA